MPALHLCGRKWLAATDDLVFPGLFELVLRALGLVLIGLVCGRYYSSTWECARGGHLVRAYLIGMLVLLSIVMLTLVALINRSAQGSIMNTRARRHVPALLVFKVALVVPEVGWNVLGTLWAFSPHVVQCSPESFTNTVIEVMVLFDWVLFALTIFGLAVVFDPIGSLRAERARARAAVDGDLMALESTSHRRVTALWVRRFRLLFCWVRRDDGCTEAFQQVAGLLAALFRNTDVVPSDVLVGCILLRVKRKRETRERRRLELLEPRPTPQPPAARRWTDPREVLADAPPWVCLERAKHLLRLSMAAYGWPFVMYQHCGTGLFRLMRRATCCACFRSKTTIVTDDNCCLCNLAGVKYMSRLPEHDILYASFRNHLFELPFCVVSDHKTASIVVAIRGSISLRDIFTDLTATAERFKAEGVPPDTMAHKGMLLGAQYIKKRLEDSGILDRAFNLYPNYGLILTGHSLGAGVAVLLALMLRPKYPDLKVYAFATPAGLLSREAARYTEKFVVTIGVGDDFVMRLSVDSAEDLRTQILEVLGACRLPKYRVILNGCGYALFGVPSRDLESTWRTSEVVPHPQETPLSSRTSTPKMAVPRSPVQRPGIFLSQTHPFLGGHSWPGESFWLRGEKSKWSSEDKSVSWTRKMFRAEGKTGHIRSDCALLAKNIAERRFSRSRLFTAGRILHITHRKKSRADRRAGRGGPAFEMRWAPAEEFAELRVEPRMLLDHLPENIYKTLETVLSEQPTEIGGPAVVRRRGVVRHV